MYFSRPTVRHWWARDNRWIRLGSSGSLGYICHEEDGWSDARRRMQHGRQPGLLRREKGEFRVPFLHPAVTSASSWRRFGTLRPLSGLHFLQFSRFLVHATFRRTVEALRLWFHLKTVQICCKPGSTRKENKVTIKNMTVKHKKKRLLEVAESNKHLTSSVYVVCVRANFFGYPSFLFSYLFIVSIILAKIFFNFFIFICFPCLYFFPLRLLSYLSCLSVQ